MVRRSLLKIATLCLAGLIACAATAGAQPLQDRKNPNYDADGTPFTSKYYAQYPKGVFVSLRRDPKLPPSHVILHLGLEFAMSGCPKLSPLQSETKMTGNEIEVTVEDYRVDMRGLPQNPHYECAKAQPTPATEVVFSKEQLSADRIERIRLRVGKVSDFYDVRLSDQMLLLMPSAASFGQTQYYKPLKLARVENPLKFWFYPENTMILYVPDAPPDKDMREDVRAMALAQGLTPLENIYTDFRSPVKDPNFFYYVDEKGKYAGKVNEMQGTAIGAIATEKTVYGLVADEKVVQNMDVYAKRPGAYE